MPRGFHDPLLRAVVARGGLGKTGCGAGWWKGSIRETAALFAGRCRNVFQKD